jgi:hypothetical protein
MFVNVISYRLEVFKKFGGIVYDSFVFEDRAVVLKVDCGRLRGILSLETLSFAVSLAECLEGGNGLYNIQIAIWLICGFRMMVNEETFAQAKCRINTSEVLNRKSRQLRIKYLQLTTAATAVFDAMSYQKYVSAVTPLAIAQNKRLAEVWNGLLQRLRRLAGVPGLAEHWALQSAG